MKFIIFFPLVVLLPFINPLIFYLTCFLPQRWKTQMMNLILKTWCKAILLSFGIKLHYHKKPSSSFAKKPLLILCNHQSFMDIVFLVYLFQCGFILKSSLMRTPFGWNAKFFGSIALHRTSISRKVKKDVQKDYNRIASLCLFQNISVERFKLKK